MSPRHATNGVTGLARRLHHITGGVEVLSSDVEVRRERPVSSVWPGFIQSVGSSCASHRIAFAESPNPPAASFFPAIPNLAAKQPEFVSNELPKCRGSPLYYPRGIRRRREVRRDLIRLGPGRTNLAHPSIDYRIRSDQKHFGLRRSTKNQIRQRGFCDHSAVCVYFSLDCTDQLLMLCEL